MKINKDEILISQEKIGSGLYVITIILMMAVQWMTVDMYLPALPVLKEEFASSEAMLNFSLNSDVALCAFGTLIGGTLSDKYGRNPVMRTGLIMAMIGMFLAAASQSVLMLTIMRGFTGLGGGFSLAVGTAMIRDSFAGNTFRTITTLTQAAAIVGPLLAPAAGAFLVEYLSWRWIFIILGIATVLTTIPFCFATETWPEEKRNVESVWQATIQSFNIARNTNFLAMIFLMMIISVPMWVYIGICSYVYYDYFGVSNIEYSLLYTMGTICSFLAPFIYIGLAPRIRNRFIIDGILLALIVATGALAIMGALSPVLFVVSVIPCLMAEAIIRPMSMVIILEEYPDEAGSASAVSGFAGMMIGVVATAIATLNWSSFIGGMVIISAVCIVISIVIWVFMIKKKIYGKQLGF